MEIAYNLKTYDKVDKEYKRFMDLGVESIFPPATQCLGDSELVMWLILKVIYCEASGIIPRSLLQF
ncbi:MAG: hypothetical protein LBB61_09140 [Treponema sp.]|nr:hypothetical protein [Treponema sp.]